MYLEREREKKERERLCNIGGNLIEDFFWSVRLDMFFVDRVCCCYMGLGIVCFFLLIRVVMYKYFVVIFVFYIGVISFLVSWLIFFFMISFCNRIVELVFFIYGKFNSSFY